MSVESLGLDLMLVGVGNVALSFAVYNEKTASVLCLLEDAEHARFLKLS